MSWAGDEPARLTCCVKFEIFATYTAINRFTPMETICALLLFTLLKHSPPFSIDYGTMTTASRTWASRCGDARVFCHSEAEEEMSKCSHSIEQWTKSSFSFECIAQLIFPLLADSIIRYSFPAACALPDAGFLSASSSATTGFIFSAR